MKNEIPEKENHGQSPEEVFEQSKKDLKKKEAQISVLKKILENKNQSYLKQKKS
jgi:hypothetical protein